MKIRVHFRVMADGEAIASLQHDIDVTNPSVEEMNEALANELIRFGLTKIDGKTAIPFHIFFSEPVH